MCQEQTCVSHLYMVMEFDNDTFYSNGNRLTDATHNVCRKRMCVGEICVKCCDVSCCWICVSLTLRKWSVPACSLTDRRARPVIHTHTCLCTHVFHPHRVLSMLRKHVWYLRAQTLSFWTHNAHPILVMEGPNPWEWLLLKVALHKYPSFTWLTSAHTQTYTHRSCVHISPNMLSLQAISCNYSCVPTGTGSKTQQRDENIEDMERDRL